MLLIKPARFLELAQMQVGHIKFYFMGVINHFELDRKRSYKSKGFKIMMSFALNKTQHILLS